MNKLKYIVTRHRNSNDIGIDTVDSDKPIDFDTFNEKSLDVVSVKDTPEQAVEEYLKEGRHMESDKDIVALLVSAGWKELQTAIPRNHRFLIFDENKTAHFIHLDEFGNVDRHQYQKGDWFEVKPPKEALWYAEHVSELSSLEGVIRTQNADISAIPVGTYEADSEVYKLIDSADSSEYASILNVLNQAGKSIMYYENFDRYRVIPLAEYSLEGVPARGSNSQKKYNSNNMIRRKFNSDAEVGCIVYVLEDGIAEPKPQAWNATKTLAEDFIAAKTNGDIDKAQKYVIVEDKTNEQFAEELSAWTTANPERTQNSGEGKFAVVADPKATKSLDVLRADETLRMYSDCAPLEVVKSAGDEHLIVKTFDGPEDAQKYSDELNKEWYGDEDWKNRMNNSKKRKLNSDMPGKYGAICEWTEDGEEKWDVISDATLTHEEALKASYNASKTWRETCPEDMRSIPYNCHPISEEGLAEKLKERAKNSDTADAYSKLPYSVSPRTYNIEDFDKLGKVLTESPLREMIHSLVRDNEEGEYYFDLVDGESLQGIFLELERRELGNCHPKENPTYERKENSSVGNVKVSMEIDGVAVEALVTVPEDSLATINSASVITNAKVVEIVRATNSLRKRRVRRKRNSGQPIYYVVVFDYIKYTKDMPKPKIEEMSHSQILDIKSNARMDKQYTIFKTKEGAEEYQKYLSLPEGDRDTEVEKAIFEKYKEDLIFMRDFNSEIEIDPIEGAKKIDDEPKVDESVEHIAGAVNGSPIASDDPNLPEEQKRYQNSVTVDIEKLREAMHADLEDGETEEITVDDQGNITLKASYKMNKGEWLAAGTDATDDAEKVTGLKYKVSAHDEYGFVLSPTNRENNSEITEMTHRPHLKRKSQDEAKELLKNWNEQEEIKKLVGTPIRTRWPNDLITEGIARIWVRYLKADLEAQASSSNEATIVKRLWEKLRKENFESDEKAVWEKFFGHKMNSDISSSDYSFKFAPEFLEKGKELVGELGPIEVLEDGTVKISLEDEVVIGLQDNLKTAGVEYTFDKVERQENVTTEERDEEIKIDRENYIKHVGINGLYGLFAVDPKGEGLSHRLLSLVDSGLRAAKEHSSDGRIDEKEYLMYAARNKNFLEERKKDKLDTLSKFKNEVLSSNEKDFSIDLVIRQVTSKEVEEWSNFCRGGRHLGVAEDLKAKGIEPQKEKRLREKNSETDTFTVFKIAGPNGTMITTMCPSDSDGAIGCEIVETNLSLEEAQKLCNPERIENSEEGIQNNDFNVVAWKDPHGQGMLIKDKEWVEANLVEGKADFPGDLKYVLVSVHATEESALDYISKTDVSYAFPEETRDAECKKVMYCAIRNRNSDESTVEEIEVNEGTASEDLEKFETSLGEDKELLGVSEFPADAYEAAKLEVPKSVIEETEQLERAQNSSYLEKAYRRRG